MDQRFFAVLLTILSFCSFLSSAQISPRWGHASALINSSLHVYGGRIPSLANPSPNASADTNELWTLDMTQTFNTTSPPWTKGPLGPFSSALETATLGGSNFDQLIVFGGEAPPGAAAGYLAYYSFNNRSWSSSTSTPPSHRFAHSAVALSNNSIIYFGGASFPVNTLSLNNEIYLFDVTNNRWSNNSFGVAPTPRYYHSATLVDNKMYVIGGATAAGLVDIKQVYVFDTTTAQWSNMTPGGATPTPRMAHAAVATADKKILIYGGTDSNYSQILNDILILDTQGAGNWNAVQPAQSPAGRYYHSMTLVGTNIIISFGYSTSWSVDPNILVLDTSNSTYTWKTLYSPSQLQSTQPSSNLTNTNPNTNPTSSGGNSPSPNVAYIPPSNSTALLIAGVCIGAAGIAAFIFAIAIFIYMKCKKPRLLANRYDDQQPCTPPSTTPAIAERQLTPPMDYVKGFQSPGTAHGSPQVSRSGSMSPYVMAPGAMFDPMTYKSNLTPVFYSPSDRESAENASPAPSNSSRTQVGTGTSTPTDPLFPGSPQFYANYQGQHMGDLNFDHARASVISASSQGSHVNLYRQSRASGMYPQLLSGNPYRHSLMEQGGHREAGSALVTPNHSFQNIEEL